MNDNALIQLFLPIITSGLIAAGYTGVIVKQANQPTQQGVNTPPTVYFYKVGDHRYGFLRRSDEWDTINNIMVHTELQQYETTFQISALVLQNPLTPDQYTASDLVNEVAAIMQSDFTRVILFNADVGILRVTDVVNPYFTDDRDQFEASPSFDFILTHKQTRVTQDPVIDSYEYDIKRV
jgi:hypothetical protein